MRAPLVPSCCRHGEKLSKAQRYGHPTERPIFASGLSPEQFEKLVVSYLRHGLKGLHPKAGGWTWEELHAVNGGIDWESWRQQQLHAFGAATIAVAGPATVGAGAVEGLQTEPAVHPSLL